MTGFEKCLRGSERNGRRFPPKNISAKIKTTDSFDGILDAVNTAFSEFRMHKKLSIVPDSSKNIPANKLKGNELTVGIHL